MINIRSRLTYQFIALVTAILLLFSVGVYFFSKLYLEKRFYKRLQDRAITTTTLLFDLQATDSTVLRLVNISDKELLIDENIFVYDEISKMIVFSSNNGNLLSRQQLLPLMKSDQITTYARVGDYQVLGIHLKKGESDNWVVVSAIDKNGIEALEDLRRILMIMILAGILLLGLSGWFFADRALAPMSGIIKQVNGIFPEYVAKRVEHPNRSDEIGLLVATFNQLLDRIEDALIMQKMFIANVSHELKNPLTKIYSQIDVALMQKRSPEVYEKSLNSLKEDTTTLIQLTNTLLNLANTIVSSESVQKTPIRMDELLWETKGQLQKWHEDYQVQINFLDFPEDEESLIIQGNEASLKVVLMNLMDNACKFSDDNTVIVTFLANEEGIKISFMNKGSIIPASDLPFIFHPFYRSNATAQATKGHGVGLAIVSQVTRLHKGEVTVVSDKNGTIFTLSFPKNTEQF
ncbi:MULTISPECIES: HAMP domain-containing sensor histidine kinase [unclassified Arcicella]|uniref:sensor histidine kinase n=1 Tax=unclassified Arcicella TaxID=2644986 RepID=UPI002864624B|nr:MULTISPECIES: HAMP domain-containing sensor histidine kinase [unclassified Arcicella]MDR6561875.1 signal transduction histidine kinase [Arcicella sp. BE51]MDR6814021.1 signal transduction histidine kinase [Arcicella sp. BE140]MDR6825272.1 signal transduction histidine kinase [Arcicella sp. BE139]